VPRLVARSSPTMILRQSRRLVRGAPICAPGERAREFFPPALHPPPFLLAEPSHGLCFPTSSFPLLLFFLFALETSDGIHGASHAYFSVHTIIVERARRWYRIRAGSSVPRKGAPLSFFPILLHLFHLSLLLLLLLLLLFLLLFRHRRDDPASSTSTFFFIRWTFFFLPRNDFNPRQEIFDPF